MSIVLKQRASDPIESIATMAAQAEDAIFGVSPDIYQSKDLLDVEYEKIFKHQWQCVGRADELVEPGDYLTTDLGIVPVIVNKRADGTLAGMVNVCRHRLATIASGTGNAKRFACPYHGWTYDADGSLINAPRMQADFDKSNCSLKPIRVEVWNGFIYANPDIDATPLADSLKPLEALFKNFHMEKMRTLIKSSEVWNGNWKIATENFLESYHLEMTHAKSLGPFFSQDTLRMVSEGPLHAFHAFTMGDDLVHPLDPSIAYDNPDLGDEEKHIVYVGGIFPNHLFTVAYDQFTWMRTQPISVDQTLVEWGVAGAFNIPRGTRPDPNHPNLYFMNEIPHLNIEDSGVVARVHKGARSGMVTPSRLSPNEHGLLTFARFLSRCLASN
jgi:phenylpropionate dioxygenase-like ring-hydroxylating dioxygenase large terminal subunit